jgi:alkylation response protein AidB-like acyl-CoA dehydrogenase
MLGGVGRRHELLAAVRELEPLIRATADEAEAARRYPERVMHAMADAGVFRMLVPCAAGGDELDPITLLDVVEEVSRWDGSAGWLAMIGSGAGFITGFVSADVGRAIFAEPRACLAGNLGAPSARATPVPGGYRVSGRWPFVSACDHATWLAGACLVGDADLRIMVFPRADSEIVDTWTVTGLRATGSHDVAVTDLFVPYERSFWWADGPLHEGPLYRVRFMVTTHAAHALGIARSAIDALVVLAEAKVPTRTAAVLKERPHIQAHVAQAEALVQAGRDFMWRTTAEVWADLCAGRPVSGRQRALLRLAMTHAVHNSAQAVDLMWAAAGGSPIYASSPLERCFRDIHVATQHAAVGALSWEAIGKGLFDPAQAEFLI